MKEVERDMESQIASYELVIKEREDKTETISAAKIGMQYVDDGKIKEMKNSRIRLHGSFLLFMQKIIPCQPLQPMMKRL